MNLFRTLAFAACLSMSLNSWAQVSPTFNPDYDGNGTIGTNDLLGFLSTYGLPWEGATGTEGCTYLYFLEYDPAANIDDGSCATLDELICDYSLYSLTLALPGGASGEPLTVPAFGSLQSLDVTLDFGNPGGDDSWASDLRLEIGLPDGSCAAIGGYDVFGECTDLGNGSSAWGVLWNVQQDGVYTATVDLSDAGLTGTGLWSFTALNGYATSASVNYGITLQANGLCSPATAVCSNPDALGVCGGSCSADANGDGICDDVDPAQFQCGNPISYQGYNYSTVQIGNHCWFSENLLSENYQNGDPIPSGLDDFEWLTTISGAATVYGDNSFSCENFSPDINACDPFQSLNEYGRLYNFRAVIDARGLCPSGWHVSTDGEWTAMTEHLEGASVAGGQMKTDYGWYGGGNGTNSSGFSGLPGGLRTSGGDYILAGSSGLWWSPLGNEAPYLFRVLDYDNEGVSTQVEAWTPGFALSVRCVVYVDNDGAICTSDVDSDGICDDVDPCVGSYDACGVCGGSGVDADGDGVCDDVDDCVGTLNALGVCESYCLGDFDGDGICDSFAGGPCANEEAILYQGFIYELVEIGDQCWFAQNLRSENYANGDAIPSNLSDSEWQYPTSGATTVNGEIASNLETYGRLYNWYAVDDARGLCPSDWHVPTDDEWTVLTDHLGGDCCAGEHMKTTNGWGIDYNGTNSSGFSGLPGGWRDSYGIFWSAGSSGFWWSSSPIGNWAWCRYLFDFNESVGRDYYDPRYGFSVRCVRDAE